MVAVWLQLTANVEGLFSAAIDISQKVWSELIGNLKVQSNFAQNKHDPELST